MHTDLGAQIRGVPGPSITDFHEGLWRGPMQLVGYSLHLGYRNGTDFGQFFRIKVQKALLQQLHGRLDHGAVVLVEAFVGGCGCVSGHNERLGCLVKDHVVIGGYRSVHFNRKQRFRIDQCIQVGFRKILFIYVVLAENKVQNPQQKGKVGSRTDGQPLRIGLSHFIGMPGIHHGHGQAMAKSLAELGPPTVGNDGASHVPAHDKAVIRVFIVAGVCSRIAETQDRLGTAGNDLKAGIPITHIIGSTVQIEKFAIPNHGRGKPRKQDHLFRLPVVAKLLEFFSNEIKGFFPGRLAEFPLSALSGPYQGCGDSVGVVERANRGTGAAAGPMVFMYRAGLQPDYLAIFDIGVCGAELGTHLA